MMEKSFIIKTTPHDRLYKVPNLFLFFDHTISQNTGIKMNLQ